MTQLTLTQGTQNKALSQWFTPRETAARIVEWSLNPLASYQAVLEPSAGNGALALAIRAYERRVAIGSPMCVDIDEENCARLRAHGFETICADFLQLTDLRRFDVAIMNPPFEGGQTERHILHALKFCDRVVCHCPLTTLAGNARRVGLWSKVRLSRLAICSTRPKYGDKGGATDMCTVDVFPIERNPSHPAGCSVEWWP